MKNRGRNDEMTSRDFIPDLNNIAKKHTSLEENMHTQEMM